MQDLILYIVKNLVTNPDAVSVEETHDGGEVNLNLTVDPVDMGLVIGKSGQTIKAIRKILIVKAMADNVRVNLQLAEPEGGRPDRSADKETLPSADAEGQQVSEPAESADQLTSEPGKSEPSDVILGSEAEPLPSGDEATPESNTEVDAGQANFPEGTRMTEKPEKPKKAKKPRVSEEAEKLVEKHVDEIAQQD